MDQMPARLPLAAVTVCLPLLLLLARVGPGPLAAPSRGSGQVDPLAGASPAPAIQVLEMPPMLIVASSAAVRADRGASAEPGAQAPPAVNAPPAQAHRQPKGPSALVGRVNVNTATAEQLALLPGLGPRRAAALIALRTRRPLRRTRDVTRVRGIGRRTWRRWRPFLAVSGETTLGRPRAGLTVLPTVPDSARGHPR